MTLRGKDADDFTAQIARRVAERRLAALLAAKEDAKSRGKEPFDLMLLEQLCDTSSEGHIIPLERRYQKFEEMYYVKYPDILTITEFAAVIEELNKW